MRNTSFLREGGLIKRSKVFKDGSTMLVALLFIVSGSMLQIWNSQPTYYAQAYEVDNGRSCSRVALLQDDGEQSFEIQDQSGLTLADVIKSQERKAETEQFAAELYEMVGETPIKEMVPFISEREERVAAFLVGIAKKESSWGEHVPTQNGKDCYNYWGYKGSASRGSALGYACFADQKEAVEIVGNRIEVLVNKNHNTASKMLVWKCGSSCAGHDPKGVESWVSTVALYLNKIIG